MTKENKIMLVSVAVALALWSAFNMLDWAVEASTINNTEAQPYLYLTVFALMFAILLYFGATKKILKNDFVRRR